MSLASLNTVFGAEPVNYYGKSFINRLSFLRTDYDFLHQAVVHPSTKFLVLDGLSPPISKIDTKSDDKATDTNINNDPATLPPHVTRPPLHKLEFLNYKDVKDFIGEPYTLSEQEQVNNWDSKRDAAGAGKPILVFLGLEQTHPDSKSDSDSSPCFTYTQSSSGTYHGIPYFAIDISESYLQSEHLLSAAKAIKSASQVSAFFGNDRFNPFGFRLSAEESGVVAHARQYVDWNARNRYCGGCGSLTMSVNGGTKLVCPATDAGIPKEKACATRGVISNLQFPRTDTSIISAVINYTGDKILLGRGKRFPPGFYSCLAGFLEPAETIEDCVRREVWEESGVTVGRVVMYSSQPWPFPANIMVGCIAQVTDPESAAHAIHLGHDPELADAQWFGFEEVRKCLKYSETGTFGKRPEELKEGEPQLPPPEAVAWILIDAVVNGRIDGLVKMNK